MADLTDSGQNVSYVEYDDSKTYYITLNSPVNIVNGTSSIVENTPEPEPGYSTTKLYSARSFLEDSLALSSSSFTLTPDKEPVEQVLFCTPERGGGSRLGGNQADSGKRGRPRADVINSLIMEGSASGSNIKCKICSRWVRLRLH